jgi:hypothetical protein
MQRSSTPPRDLAHSPWPAALVESVALSAVALPTVLAYAAGSGSFSVLLIDYFLLLTFYCRNCYTPFYAILCAAFRLAQLGNGHRIGKRLQYSCSGAALPSHQSQWDKKKKGNSRFEAQWKLTISKREKDKRQKTKAGQRAETRRYLTTETPQVHPWEHTNRHSQAPTSTHRHQQAPTGTNIHSS